MRHLVFLIIFIIFYSGCSTKTEVTKKEYLEKPLQQINLKNFHKVDNKLFRSAQPSKEEFKKLYNMGIRYDLNLRQYHSDEDKLQNLNIFYKNIPTSASKFTYEQLVNSVAFLIATKGKTLVHCKHGSDRTGVVVAGYRIVAHGWNKERAIDEFVNGGYGYHSFWFRNLPNLLKNINETKFKKDVMHKINF